LRPFYILFLLLLITSTTLHSQIPNAGFENWDANGNPINWVVSNAPSSYITITKTSEAHSGSWAVEGNVFAFSPVNVAPTLYSGEEGEQGIPINFRPATLDGYYKLVSAGGDYLQIQALFYKNNTPIGSGIKELNAAGSYTQFNCDITYFTADVPDTVLILITASNSSFFSNVGTKIFVDDLIWGSTTDITKPNEQIPQEFNLEQNYPNPFNPSTKISWQSPVGSHQTLKIYDLLGREVLTLFDEYKSAGNYEITFDASSLTSGIYFYRLQAGDFVGIKKMILLK
jgi:hypothetical protein